MEKNRYDAFISYRHAELDKYVAITLQKKLEAFKLPKGVVSPTGKKKIERVFRDQDELPLSANLSDPITEALQSSDYLIVICTPRLPESEWCKREIETFISLHGRERILAVLAEGEPEESFPEALTKEAYEVKNPDGSIETKYHYFEPLAADVRGKNNKEINKAMHDAVLRLAASIFGLNYDALKQRHKERAMRRTLSIVSGVAAAMMLFSAVCIALMFKIMSQSEMIMDQNTEIKKQNDEIKAQSAQIQAQSEQIQEQYTQAQLSLAKATVLNAQDLLDSGRKFDAIYALRKVMPTSSSDTSYPYSYETESALTEALDLYADSGLYIGDMIFESESSIRATKISDDETEMVTLDSTNNLLVWDLATGDQILSKKLIGNFNYREFRSFIITDKNTLIYNDNDEIKIYDLESNTESVLPNPLNTPTHKGELYRYPYLNKFVLFTNDGFEIYDMANKSCIAAHLYSDTGLAMSPYLHALDFSADGNEMYFACASGPTDFIPIYKYDIAADTFTSYETGLMDVSSLCVNNDELLYSGNTDFMSQTGTDYIISIDKNTGKENWRVKTISTVKEIYLSSESNYIYAHGYDYLYTLTSDGTLLSSLSTSEGICNMFPTEGNGVIVYLNNCKKHVLIGDTPDMLFSYDVFYNAPAIKAASFNLLDENIIVSFEEKNYVSLFKKKTSSAELLLNCPSSMVNCFNSEDQILLRNSIENTYEIYSLGSDTPTVSVDYDNYNYSFVGDGKDLFAQFGAGIKIYNVSDGTLFKEVHRTQAPNFTANGVTYDQNYLLSTKSPKGQLYLYSLLTGEVENISKPDIPEDEDYDVYGIDKDNYAIKRETGLIEIYKSDKAQPYLTLSRAFSQTDNFTVCHGAKIICASYFDGTVELYRFGENTELVKTLHLPDSHAVEGLYYYPEQKIYVVKYGYDSYILNEDLDVLSHIPADVYYLPSLDVFAFYSKDGFYSLPHYRYDDLMRISDELLGDYLPSKSTMEQYGILD